MENKKKNLVLDILVGFIYGDTLLGVSKSSSFKNVINFNFLVFLSNIILKVVISDSTLYALQKLSIIKPRVKFNSSDKADATPLSPLSTVGYLMSAANYVKSNANKPQGQLVQPTQLAPQDSGGMISGAAGVPVSGLITPMSVSGMPAAGMLDKTPIIGTVPFSSNSSRTIS